MLGEKHIFGTWWQTKAISFERWWKKYKHALLTEHGKHIRTSKMLPMLGKKHTVFVSFNVFATPLDSAS